MTTAESPSSSTGGHELVWKTSEGAEKRLVLPIEMIKEDVMDDPERLLKKINSDNSVTQEDRAKILSAFADMKDSVRREKLKEAASGFKQKKTDPSAFGLDKSVYIADESSLSKSPSGRVTLTGNLNVTIQDGDYQASEVEATESATDGSLMTSL